MSSSHGQQAYFKIFCVRFLSLCLILNFFFLLLVAINCNNTMPQSSVLQCDFGTHVGAAFGDVPTVTSSAGEIIDGISVNE